MHLETVAEIINPRLSQSPSFWRITRPSDRESADYQVVSGPSRGFELVEAILYLARKLDAHEGQDYKA